MAVLEAVLAVIGVGLLILLAVGTLADRPPTSSSEEDIAAPYREGLHAAIRMQRVAQDLEQQIYAEAARHAESGPGSPQIIDYRQRNTSCTKSKSSSSESLPDW